MKPRRIVLRARADRDLRKAVQQYLDEAGASVALGLIDAVERAFRQIAHNPSAGSPRYAHELDLPGLRHRPIKRYPYLIFYVAGPEHVDIWRILHAHRDIPGSMRPEDED